VPWGIALFLTCEASCFNDSIYRNEQVTAKQAELLRRASSLLFDLPLS
jgi:hypothetical protein